MKISYVSTHSVFMHNMGTPFLSLPMVLTVVVMDDFIS